MLKPIIVTIRWIVLIACLIAAIGWTRTACAQTNGAIRIVELSGTVEILSHGENHWLAATKSAQLYPFDRVRTGPNSSIGLLWSDQSVLRFSAISEMEILPPDTDQADHGLHLIQGFLSFFHRDKPGRIRIITSGASAGIE